MFAFWKWLISFVPLFAEDPDGGGAPAGEGADTAAGGEGADTSSGALGEDTQGGSASTDVGSGMLKAISEQLKPAADPAKKAPAKGEDTQPGAATDDKTKAGAKGADPAKDAAAAGKTGDPNKKAPKADDFALTPEEKKALTQASQQRFHELHKLAKTHEGTITQQQQHIAALEQARDEIMGVFEEYQVDPQELVPLLEYNLAVKTGKLDDALRIVEKARASILTAMGREAPGVDLLAEFPDLRKRVDDEALTREDALEIANARRRAKGIEERSRAQTTEREREQASQQKRDKAVKDIEAWTAQKAREDIDYAAKESKILAKLKGVISRYPPELWLPTLQDLYEAIEVAKPASDTTGTTPLRPSGAKGGAKEPANMLEALSQGLGYQQA